MPIQIGAKQEHGFDQPLGLMNDCHRRVEKFLGALMTVARENPGQSLTDPQREALEKSLRYFRSAAPWHTADEEQSLFPRLRQIDHPEVRKLLKQVDALEADHRTAEAAHEQAHALVDLWLERGRLSDDEHRRLVDLLQQLDAIYREHIALEDEQVFPTAQRVLSENQLRAVGREMADRRGVDPCLPPRRCRHGSASRK